MKKFYIVIAVFISFSLLISCQQKEINEKLQEFENKENRKERNKEIVYKYFAFLDNNDFKSLKDILADNFSYKSPNLSTSLNRDGFIQEARTKFVSFPDWHHAIEEIVADEDKVVVKYTNIGTHRETYKGIPPTGKTISISALSFFVLEYGKIKEIWNLENSLDFYRQLGIELPSDQESVYEDFSEANKGIILIEAGIVYKWGDVTPVARTKFYLSRKSLKAIINEVKTKNGEKISEDPLMELAIVLWAQQDNGLTKKGEEELNEIIESINENSFSTKVTDFKGNAKFYEIAPGTWYIIGFTSLRKGIAIWDVKVNVKSGNNTVVLDQNNALVFEL